MLPQTARSLWRAPLFTIVVVLLLAIGIGANTVIFTAVNALLLRPLPVSAPEQLLRMGVVRSPTLTSYDHPYLYAQSLRQHSRSFSYVFASWSVEMAYASGDSLRTVSGETVSGNYFEALGLRAAAGRLISSTDEEHDATIAILNHGFASREFGNPQNALGKTVRLRGHPFTVVGVAPRSFTGLDLDLRTDVWIPMSAVRLWSMKPDISRTAARIYLRARPPGEIGAALAEVQALYPTMVLEGNAGLSGVTNDDIRHQQSLSPTLDSIARGASNLRKTFAGAVATLLGGVLVLLLLLCANISGIILARSQVHSRDVALRISLGATRGALLRRALVEGLLLSIAGAVLGGLLAFMLAPLLLNVLPNRQPLAVDLSADWRVLSFVSALCMATTLLVSMAPVAAAARADAALLLQRSSSRVAGGGVARALVAAQIAAATVLALGGVSLVKTLHALRGQDPGFRRDRVVVLTVNPRLAGLKSDQLPATYREVARRFETLPDVESVSISERPLMRGVGFKATAGVAGSRPSFAQAFNVSLNGVSENYFQALGIRLMEGRMLRNGDSNLKPKPVVVSRGLAKHFFPEGSCLGRLFGTGPAGTVMPGSHMIVGVVSDAKYRTMRETPPPTVYGLFDFDGTNFADSLAFHVVMRHGATTSVEHLRRALSQVGPGLVPTDVATMEQEIETSLWQERLLALLSSAFGIVALVVAAAGIFGMLSYAVSTRMREIGVRIALGATAPRISGMIIKDAAVAVVPGILFGYGLYAYASNALVNLLFGTRPWDIASTAAVSAGVTGLALLASALPTIRATRIQPAEILKID